MLPAGPAPCRGPAGSTWRPPAGVPGADRRPRYTSGRIARSASRRMPLGPAFVTVSGMRDPDTGGGPALPLGRRLAVHQFTNAQLLAIDVVTVTVITVVAQFAMYAPGTEGVGDSMGNRRLGGLPRRRRGHAVAAARAPHDAGGRPADCGRGPVPAGGRRDGLLRLSWPCTPSWPSPRAAPRWSPPACPRARSWPGPSQVAARWWSRPASAA